MPSPSERARNNVKAGVFVIVAIALAVSTIIVLTDAWRSLTEPTTQHRVTFSVADGVKNLKQGADVRVGGVLMGHVGKVTPHFDSGGVLDRIDVDFSLAQDVTLYANATVVVTPAVIGASAWLDIYSVGTPGGAGGGPVPVEGIKGISPPGIMATLVGADNAGKVGQMVTDASVFVSDLKTAGGDVKSLADQIANDDWPRWAARVDTVTEWAAGAGDKIDAVLVEYRSVMADNRPKIDGIVDNVHGASGDVQEVTQRIRDQTMQKVEDLLDRGREGVDAAVAVLERLDRDSDIWVTDVTDALANARLTAQQLKLTSIEVRRSPWKLLYRPGRSEMEHELLYEAARSFAMAASDLKAASASTELMLNGSAPLDPATQKLVNEFLGSSLEHYQKAQQRLIDVLLTN